MATQEGIDPSTIVLAMAEAGMERHAGAGIQSYLLEMRANLTFRRFT